jgi:hypothetical protein
MTEGVAPDDIEDAAPENPNAAPPKNGTVKKTKPVAKAPSGAAARANP